MQSRETWKLFSTYYDSYIKDFSADLSLYQQACTPQDRVVEVGCGSGRVLKFLLEMGHPLTGVDISEEMLQRSRQRLDDYLRQGKLKLVNHDFAAGPIEGSFTLALVTYYTFNYVLDYPDKFLSNLYAALVPQGRIILDLFFPKTRRNPDIDGIWVKESIIHDGKPLMVMEKRTWLAKKQLEERVQVFDDGGSQHEVVTHRRYFTPQSIKELLATAGFANPEFGCGYAGVWRDEIPDADLHTNFVVRASRQS